MAIEKRKYTLEDMVSKPLDSAPSLDLPAFEIEKFYVPKDVSKFMVFFLNVKKSWKPQSGCPYCDNKTSFSLSGRNAPRVIRDVSRNNYCVQLITQSPRLLCNKCHQRFTPKIDGIVENGTMTERLLNFVKTESFLQPHTILAERTGLSIQTIQNIMDDEIQRYEEMRVENPLVAPEVLGIDEKHIVHDMRGTLVDVKTGNLLDLTERNDELTMVAAIQKLKDWDKNIRVVTTDMSNSYLRWLPKLLPNATFVIDKFHVFQNVNQKVSSSKKYLYEYRKQLIREIEDDAERKRQTEILKIIGNNKRLFNYSTENLERGSGVKALKLDTVIDEFPEFALLRKLYAYVELLYQQTNRKDAEIVWDEWQKLLPPSTKGRYKEWCDKNSIPLHCFEAFQSLTRSGFTYFKEYILNYFNPGCNYTNATTEGLNNLIGTINAAGNGYKFKHLRAKALYASLINERVRFSIDIKSIDSWKPSSGGFSMIIPMSRDKYMFNHSRENVFIPTTNVLSDNQSFSDSLFEQSNGEAKEFVLP